MKPRVLQLIGNMQASGGSERQAAQLVRSLHESGRYEVYVACLNPVGGLDKEFASLGFTDIPAFQITSFYNRTMVVQLARFVRYLRAHKIDLIQTHDFYTNIFGMLGAGLAGVPARIATRRETIGWRTPFQKFIEHRAYQLAHAIVTNAAAVQEHLMKEGVPGAKIQTVYNGLCLERVAPTRERRAALELFHLPPNGDCRYVTIVANLLHAVKDHPTFLRAAQRVRQAVPEARFVLAGEGRLEGEMRALARTLGLENDVFFTGRCIDVADLLSISDVCVLSSTAEGFSNSILEYMGAGRPVVATNVGGAPEAIVEGKTGYLVAPGDDQTMAARIIELLRDSVRARVMGRYGRQVVEQKFSRAAQLAQTEKLYKRLLAGRKQLSDKKLWPLVD